MKGTITMRWRSLWRPALVHSSACREGSLYFRRANVSARLASVALLIAAETAPRSLHGPRERVPRGLALPDARPAGPGAARRRPRRAWRPDGRAARRTSGGR